MTPLNTSELKVIENNGFTRHALKCFAEHCQRLKIPFDIHSETAEELAKFFLVAGVKIGGTYKHWKGGEYIVIDVCQNSDDWSRFRVVYIDKQNAMHKADRDLDEFLGIHENGQRRFTLIR